MFDRIYKREIAIWTVVMLVASFAMVGLAKAIPAGSPFRVFALAPYLLAMIGFYWTELRQIARMDELQRLIYLSATLSGSVVFASFCALAYAGEALKIWPRVAPIWGLAAMGAGFAIGIGLARRRYAG